MINGLSDSGLYLDDQGKFLSAINISITYIKNVETFDMNKNLKNLKLNNYLN